MLRSKLEKYIQNFDDLRKNYLNSDSDSIYKLEEYILNRMGSICIDDIKILAEDNTQKILESIDQEIRIIRLEHIIKKLLKRVNTNKKRGNKMTEYIFTGKDMELKDLIEILEKDIQEEFFLFKGDQSIQDYKNNVSTARERLNKSKEVKNE